MTETLLTPQNNNFVGCRAYLASGMTNLGDGYTNINMDTVSYDTESAFTSGANSHYTIPISGLWQITLCFRWANPINAKRYYCVVSNGDYEGAHTDVGLFIGQSGGDNSLSTGCTTLTHWDKDDLVYFGAYKSTGVATEDLNAGSQNCWVTLQLITEESL